MEKSENGGKWDGPKFQTIWNLGPSHFPISPNNCQKSIVIFKNMKYNIKVSVKNMGMYFGFDNYLET